MQSLLRIVCILVVGTVVLILQGCSGSGASGTAGANVESPTATGSSSSPGTSVNALELGVFSGGSDPSAAAAFETWLGRKSDFNVDFLSDQGYTGSQNLVLSASYDVSQWVAAKRPDRNMLFSIPLTTLQDPSLQNVAAGMYDTAFQQVAQSIVQAYPDAIIRIGWEFNADWYPWSATSQPADYVAAFRRVALIFKSLSAGFRIDWCPNLGSPSMDAELAYPGDDVVDVVGMDVYDNWNYSTSDTAAQRWNYIENGDHGLVWQRQFASAHGKPMSFPEWGVNHDDSYFIQMMYEWITGNNFAYASYWDSNAGFSGEIDNGQYPNAAAEYRKDFAPVPNN